MARTLSWLTWFSLLHLFSKWSESLTICGLFWFIFIFWFLPHGAFHCTGKITPKEYRPKRLARQNEHNTPQPGRTLKGDTSKEKGKAIQTKKQTHAKAGRQEHRVRYQQSGPNYILTCQWFTSNWSQDWPIRRSPYSGAMFSQSKVRTSKQVDDAQQLYKKKSVMCVSILVNIPTGCKKFYFYFYFFAFVLFCSFLVVCPLLSLTK